MTTYGRRTRRISVGAGLLATSLVRLYGSGAGFNPRGVENIAFSLDNEKMDAPVKAKIRSDSHRPAVKERQDLRAWIAQMRAAGEVQDIAGADREQEIGGIVQRQHIQAELQRIRPDQRRRSKRHNPGQTWRVHGVL